jgi:CSLREA domain-containing protein
MSMARYLNQQDSLRKCLKTGLASAVLLGSVWSAHAASPITLTVNNFDDTGPGNCSSVCTLRDAIKSIAADGTIDFAGTLVPATITLTQGELAITRGMTIRGPGAGKLSIDANGLSRVLEQRSGGGSEVYISGLTLRDGTVSGADGVDGGSGTGANGTYGSFAAGGCVSATSGSLTLSGVAIRNCLAQGGKGGNGGSGTHGSGVAAGGLGGNGSLGASAGGGAIEFYSSDSLLLVDSTVTNSKAVGGAGGDGGRGGSGGISGTGGAGGDGGFGFGGALFSNSNRLVILNSTITGSGATGGSGGTGGQGDISSSAHPGGNGGNGANAYGGLVTAIGLDFMHIGFATFADGNVLAGAGGVAGGGKISGVSGFDGLGSGDAISAKGLVSISVLSTAIVGDGGNNLCDGLVAAVAGSENLSEDSSCAGFTLRGKSGEVFRTLDSNAPMPAYMPVYHSTLIDAAASCKDENLSSVTADQYATARPQGNACDIGAIEADYIFVDGIE